MVIQMVLGLFSSFRICVLHVEGVKDKQTLYYCKPKFEIHSVKPHN